MPTLEEIRLVYGKDAVMTRKGAFTLVHLDRPSQSLLRARTRDFDPQQFFFDDCPLCQMVKSGGIIVYDDPAPSEDG